MTVELERLPENVAELKRIIVRQQRELQEHEQEIRRRDNEIEQQRVENKTLREQLALLKKTLFGPKSERLAPADEKQGRLFDEAEANSAGEPEKATSGVKAHKRRKRGRKPLPDWLPREEEIYDLAEEEKVCGDCGSPLASIGEKSTEELEIIPEQVFVRKTTRFAYNCPNCEKKKAADEKTVIKADTPPRLIPKSIASAGLVAYTLTAKFCDHLPFYRLEKIFSRWGVELKRATMCNWALYVAGRCKRLYELLWEPVLTGRHTGADESHLQVHGEPGRKNTTKSFMWVIRGGPPDRPAVLFEYRETREAKFLVDRLDGFKGVLQTDGYEAYDGVAVALNVVHAGCWDHARRKFREALHVSDGKSRPAKKALLTIRNMYRTEKKAREAELSPAELLELRQTETARRLRWLKRWLDRRSVEIPPRSAMGKAIKYTLNQWPKLVRFVEDPNIPISNAPVENAIRPFCVGRRNWLFSGSPRGAMASAILYSLIETARANGFEPYWYLRYLFKHLPSAKTDDELRALLPTNLDPNSIPGPTKPD